jgi:dTDP-4-amino-4,6-dideoxygalactose transaminase
VQQFEDAWAHYCGVRFCVGVGNGMEAIEIGLRAMNIGPGDEVITTPITAIATVLAIVHAGATPVLADIDAASVLLDPASVERCVTARTKAVLLVHLYGQIGEMDHWRAFCRDKDIDLLEDCAQSHGAIWNAGVAGSFGSFGAFSFYPTKNLGARGDAGALATNSEAIATRARALRNYGTRSRYEHPETGLNSRLDELQASILSARLSWLERFNARRQEIARRYLAEIENPRIALLASPRRDRLSTHVYHLFVVRCAERDRLAVFLKERDIETLIHYPIPAHRQGCCDDIKCDPHGLPNADRHARECLSIPCHPQLRDEDVDSVIAALNAFN